MFIRRASARVADRAIGHIDLGKGEDVKYAGRLYFSGRTNRGILRKWTNESGHYRPCAESLGIRDWGLGYQTKNYVRGFNPSQIMDKFSQSQVLSPQSRSGEHRATNIKV